MITLDGLTRRYGAATALHPTTLHLPAGQTTVLLGPSGCGKSTLLRLIMGLLPADAGTVRIGETLLTPDTVQALRHQMGYVIQEGGLFPHLTARANITLLARHLGWPPARIAARLDVLLPLAHLPPAVLDRYPLQLSGGQRQRVALLRALLPDPDVLLLDEPLGALDPMIRADLQQDLRAIFRQLGKTVVLVTHDLAEAGFFGDRLVLLRDGCIVQQGTLADLVHRPADPFVTAFINAQRSPLETLGGVA
jgi:osmoprotectant transport system ATP-binding protein